MIKFRNLFEQLVAELHPQSGHLGVTFDADLFRYIDADNPQFNGSLAEFLQQNDIPFTDGESLVGSSYPRQWVLDNVSHQYLPEILYFGLTKFADPDSLKNSVFAKDGDYRFLRFGDGEDLMKLVFVDDGAGQALGMMMVAYDKELQPLTKAFKKRPVQVHLSKMVPSVRGTGEGHKMYSLLLNKFGTIVSDITLFEGSFAMWDTVIRQSAPYSGVIAFGDKLVYNNTKGDVYTMSLPNRSLDRFWASKTISPWVLDTSKALSKLDAKTTLVVEMPTAKSVPLVVNIIDKVSDDNTIKDLVDYLSQDRTDAPFVYNTKHIKNPQTLLLFVTKEGRVWEQGTLEGIIRVDQKGPDLKVTLL